MQTVTVDSKLYNAMVFFLKGLAILGTLKAEHRVAHEELLKLVRWVDETEGK